MWLLLPFVVIPLIEIALFIQVGGWIGLGPTLLIVVLTAIAGSWLVRSQGLDALNRLRRSMNELADPSEPLAHGAMIVFAGALLLTPGFFTDAVGFALLVPGLRQVAFEWLRRRVRIQGFAMGGGPQARPRGTTGPQGPTRRPPQDRVIEGEYEEITEPRQRPQGPSGWTRH